MKFLGIEVNLEKFEKKHSLIKESYHGGQYIGPDCDKIFAKLDDLEAVVKEENPSSIAFVDSLRDLKEVYGMAHKEEVVENHRDFQLLKYFFLESYPINLFKISKGIYKCYT